MSKAARRRTADLRALICATVSCALERLVKRIGGPASTVNQRGLLQQDQEQQLRGDGMTLEIERRSKSSSLVIWQSPQRSLGAIRDMVFRSPTSSSKPISAR
jgi:hypothetical protein